MDALPTPHQSLFRWGNLALIAGLVFSVGLVYAVVVVVPGATLFVPLALLAGGVGVWLFTQPRLNFIVWLGGLALLFSSEKGFQVHEVAYGLYFYAYLLHWYGRRFLLYRRPVIRGSVDISVALWIVLGLTLGTALGFLFGADLTRMRGEAIALTMLLIYFPVKEFCVRDRHGPLILLAIIAWIGVWITADNLLVARQTFADATRLWEISDIRTSGRELLLTFSGILLLSILPAIREWSFRIPISLVLAILLVGLLLTKSRTFWVQYAVAYVILLALSPNAERKRLLAWGAAGVFILVMAAYVFLPSYVDLLFAGIKARFASLGSTTTDISLLNRFVETDTVIEQVSKNPVLGYGFGTDYSVFDIIASKTISKSYSHNGFIAILYKFGLWGGLLVSITWLLSLNAIWRSSRDKAASTLDRATLRGIFACSVSMVLPALTSSVFFEDEKIAAFVFITALGVGIHYKLERLHY